jgi:hypothetical protein
MFSRFCTGCSTGINNKRKTRSLNGIALLRLPVTIINKNSKDFRFAIFIYGVS